MVIGEGDRKADAGGARSDADDGVVDDGPGHLRCLDRPDLSAERLCHRRRARCRVEAGRREGRPVRLASAVTTAPKLREGIEEAIAIGERAGIPVHVFHIKVTGQKNFGRMKEVIEIVEAARARGIRVTADQYPYVASSTGLTATIPPWALDGGTARLIERLKDKAQRARIRRDMEDQNPSWESRYQSAGTWQNVQLAAIGRSRGAADQGSSPNRKYEGMRVAQAAKQAGKDPFDFVFDLLIEERGSVGCVYFIIDEADLALALKQPWVAIGSDGSAFATEGPLRAGVPHPRSFGTFPRVLGRYVRELKSHHVAGSDSKDDLAAGEHPGTARSRHDPGRPVGRPGDLRSVDGRRPGDVRGSVSISGGNR